MAMGVCMRYASDRDAAQDLMQDGFVRVFENIGRVRDPERLGAWIYRLMLNECLRQCRKKMPVQYTDDGLIDSVQLPLDPFGTEEVVAALQRLTTAQRLAFNLVEVEGYTYEEAAQKMKCSEVNVRALLCRAKERLREELVKS
jgi:RNA polymerase sigma-70 factor (ECF subfamily)